MQDDFKFLNPGKLVDGDLELLLVKKCKPDPAKKHVPSYLFNMRKVGNKQKAGRYITLWDGRDNNGIPVSSGTYFYKLKAGNFFDQKKMLLLK